MPPMDAPILRDLVPIPRVWDRLAAVERRLLDVTEASNPFLTEIAQHLIIAGGKRYRPLLAQVAGELGPSDGDGPVEAGVAVELVHAGSLYHDDVIDNAATRHGVASVNAKWDNTAAILGGDYLLARASEVAAPLGEEAVALIANTYAVLCEGQVLELQLEGSVDHGPDDYYRVIEGKTASLIRTAARLGALTSGARREDVEAISRWAWEMGIVFQLADDVLDLVADTAFLGKPAGSDIVEGTFTLPVLMAFTGPGGAEIRAALVGGGPYERQAVDRVIELVVSGGYVDEVLDEARQRLQVAEDAVSAIGNQALVDVLHSLDRYLLDRVELARA
jgi:geranylgeranyl pyrophosphate synthase